MYDFKNIKWEETYSSVVEGIYIDNDKNKIYKKYRTNAVNGKQERHYNLIIKKNYNILKLKDMYDKIKSFDFVPKMEFFEEENIIVEDYYKHRLNIFNRPNNYIYQLLNIHNTLKKNNIYHNDYKLIHFYVHNNEIKLIDWNSMSINKPKVKITITNNIYIYILLYSLDIIILFILIIIIILKN